MRFSVFSLLIPLWFSLLPATSPPPDTPPVITADTLRSLAPVARADFDRLPHGIAINTGWFTLSDDGEKIATVRTDGGLVIWSAAGDLLATFAVTDTDGGTPATVLDARFSADGEQVAMLYTVDGQAYLLAVYTIARDRLEVRPVPEGFGVPIRVWFGETTEHLWIETAPDYFNVAENAHLVLRLPLDDTPDAELLVIPSAPEADADAFVRIGRIPAPLAVTSTPDGLVRLWNLEAGEAVAEIQLEDVPVFGRVNETTGTQMAWRDQVSQALYLLDFTTGENRLIADIGGAYIQAILLTPPGDAVLAVHIGEDPVVVGWLSESGERLDLGTYRADCVRVPDMVQISRDGTTLVIGCDAGLEVWRVR